MCQITDRSHGRNTLILSQKLKAGRLKCLFFTNMFQLWDYIIEANRSKICYDLSYALKIDLIERPLTLDNL